MTKPRRIAILLIVECSEHIARVTPEIESRVQHILDVASSGTNIAIATFDDAVHFESLGCVPKNAFHVHPRGGAALWGGIGEALLRFHGMLDALPEAEKPDEAHVYLIAQGRNAPGRDTETSAWRPRTLRALVGVLQDELGWHFEELNVGEFAHCVGPSLGFRVLESSR